MSKTVSKIILAVALAVVAFFWIWLFRYLGAAAYWVALVSFAIYIASGAEGFKLPWMTLGAVVGLLLGFITYAISMQIFPMFATISSAIAGAIFILIGALISVPKIYEMLPMFLVGWASFLGAMARFDYLILENAVEAMPRVLHTLLGVLFSLLFGLLLGALLGTPLLKLGREKAESGETQQGVI